jgi:hypothetical protein
MRLFNSFQIVAAFVAWPFGIAWLANHQDFTGASAAFIAACTLYVIAFGAMVGAVYSSTEKWEL